MDKRETDHTARWRPGRWVLVMAMLILALGVYGYLFFHDVEPPDDSDLTIVREAIADDQNMAKALAGLFDELPTAPESDLELLEVVELLARAVSLADEEIDVEELANTYSSWAPQLTELRGKIFEIAALPRFHQEFDPNDTMGHLSTVRDLLEFLRDHSQLVFHYDQDPQLALENTRAAVKIAREYCRYPESIVGMLVATAVVEHACDQVARLLRLGTVSDQDLSELSRLLSPSIWVTPGEFFRDGMLGEYDAYKAYFKKVDFAQVTLLGEDLSEFHYRPHRTHRDYVEFIRDLSRILDQPPETWKHESQKWNSYPRSEWAERIDFFRGNSAGEALMRRVAAGLVQSLNKSLNMTCQLRCTRVAIAMHRYRTARGRFPADLNELVPGYLNALPVDLLADDAAPLLHDTKHRWIYSAGSDVDEETPNRRYSRGVQYGSVDD